MRPASLPPSPGSTTGRPDVLGHDTPPLPRPAPRRDLSGPVPVRRSTRRRLPVRPAQPALAPMNRTGGTARHGLPVRRRPGHQEPVPGDPVRQPDFAAQHRRPASTRTLGAALRRRSPARDPPTPAGAVPAADPADPGPSAVPDPRRRQHDVGNAYVSNASLLGQYDVGQHDRRSEHHRGPVTAHDRRRRSPRSRSTGPRPDPPALDPAVAGIAAAQPGRPHGRSSRPDNSPPRSITTGRTTTWAAGRTAPAPTDDYRQHPALPDREAPEDDEPDDGPDPPVRRLDHGRVLRGGPGPARPSWASPTSSARSSGSTAGKNVRYRSFFVLDRTKATGFNPYYPGDFRDCVTYRRRIE